MSSTGTTASWFKSSFSKEAANCVEVRFSGDSVFVRDSKYLRVPGNDRARQPVIEVPAFRWTAFLASVIDPNRVADPALPAIVRTPFGISVTAGETSLLFTADEWIAFVAGVEVGEFAAA